MATNNATSRSTSSASAIKAGSNGTSSRPQSNTSKRGFASMDPEQQRRIASEGGKASHASGRGHEWTSAEAREAGRKGGQNSTRRNTSKTA
ncbi:KGG domain-containing protein [Hymenobacter sp. 15J16-1T3B]|uniref:KGG domain-containing protein n=1 Tax=Hymenobacter sp. 15J16-1T3B TaxID=2886941 RepID=UPI001D0FC357|nr:KGG domain-containing protein [Hymenobacter sp. 15J16-1T3B]MCC3157660.1 KGG domain-containing protein [Hymenobacter sp. 15J16-1T3B]